MIDFRQLQKDVYQNKVNHNFNVTDINMEFCLAYGELGEAYMAWLKKKDDLGEELADVAIYLLGISEIVGVDLEKEIMQKEYTKLLMVLLLRRKVKMESINLEKLQELIDLFKKFNIDTLDSIGILLQYTKNLSRETNFAFINVYKEKALEMRNEFEGINEYDYICKVNNFNLSEIERIIDSLNNDELKYLRVLINNAYNNIDKDSIENKILESGVNLQIIQEFVNEGIDVFSSSKVEYI